MRESPSTHRRGRGALLVTLAIALFLVVASCTPSIESCEALAPVYLEEVEVAETPDGASGCVARRGPVVVHMELRRDGLGWKQGRFWVDGHETRLEDLRTEITWALRRRRAREEGESDRPADEEIGRLTSELLESLKEQ